MKIRLTVFAVLMGLTSLNAQSIKDAMRYTQTDLHGTARFTSMSGAFGALGGDLSAININPASSAVFNNNHFAVTMGNYSTENNSNYFGGQSSADESSFDLNQAGAVFVFRNHKGSPLRKFTMAINYEQTNNYDNSLFSAGVSPVNSVGDYFLYYANSLGIPLGLLENEPYAALNYGEQQAFLGYQSYIINPLSNDPNNTLYESNVRAGGNYLQNNNFYASGYNGKLIFNGGIQYNDNLFIGFNLNSHFTDYIQNTEFYESNRNPLDQNFRVESIGFSNSLHTYGNGFSFQIGTIAKVTEELRLGLSYESPTWYNLQDELSQRVTAISKNNLETKLPDTVDPLVINYYPSYDLNTPGSFTASMAYVFAKTGLLSLDYKYKDYGQTKFEPESDPSFRNTNMEIKNTLGSSNELRLGAEYKVDRLRLRGGYRFEGSPYKDGRTIGDLNSFSAGLGYSFGAIKLDFSYVNIQRSSVEQFFSQGFTESAKIDTRKNNFTMTFVFEL